MRRALLLLPFLRKYHSQYLAAIINIYYYHYLPLLKCSVEATPVAELESARTSREANPQFYGPYSYPASAFFQPQQQYPVNPSIDGPYFYNYPGYQSYYQSGPYGPNPGYNSQKWLFNGITLPTFVWTETKTILGGVTTVYQFVFQYNFLQM